MVSSAQSGKTEVSLMKMRVNHYLCFMVSGLCGDVKVKETTESSHCF